MILSTHVGASRVPPRLLAVWTKTLRGQLISMPLNAILYLTFYIIINR